MSIRENIQFFRGFDIEEFLNILREEYDAIEHSDQSGDFLVEGIPFYKPHQFEDHVSILGFNYIPLPDTLIQALIDHPELAPDDTIVRWTQEQDIILEATLGELRRNYL